MKTILLYLKRRFFCKHEFNDVPSKWYIHKRCNKCGYEWGIGNFKWKQ